MKARVRSPGWSAAVTPLAAACALGAIGALEQAQRLHQRHGLVAAGQVDLDGRRQLGEQARERGPPR